MRYADELGYFFGYGMDGWKYHVTVTVTDTFTYRWWKFNKISNLLIYDICLSGPIITVVFSWSLQTFS